jgi:hypothetical protein
MRKICALATLFLMGCASSSPMVSDFNGDSVKVRVACGLAYECARPRPEDNAEAQRICGTKGKKAEFASTAPANLHNAATGVTMENYEHLYLCV